MEYGFVSLCNKDDTVLNGLLKESNNIDYLGLRRMNVRLSNLMFPFANTLMPNLVYFYYLHAIYYAVLSGDENETIDKEPTKEQINEINELEKIISNSIRNIDAAKGKGFFGDVKARAYGKYKNSMKLMHFFDSKWIPTFGTNKQKNLWNNNKKPLHEYLTNTARFKFVSDLAKSENRGDTLDKIIKEKPNWLCKLDWEEKRDFIWRAIDPYGPKKGTITRYSVFSNIVMYYCGIKNKPGTCAAKIYKEDYNDSVNIKDKIKIENLYFFEKENNSGLPEKEKKYGLKKLLDDAKINVGNGGNTYSKVNQLPVYQVAEEYSKLQLIAKLAYNMCLFEKNEERKNSYKEQLTKKIENYVNENTPRGKIDANAGGDYANVFFNNGDDVLIGAFAFIQSISKFILKSDNKIEDIIKEIVDLVKKREIEVLGGNSRLDSGIAFDAMGDYEDTFRWEYRPEIERIEARESGDKDTINDLSKDEVGESNIDKISEENTNDKNKLHNMCARYYIYELFFEQ